MTDLNTACRAALDARIARHEAATPAPWTAKPHGARSNCTTVRSRGHSGIEDVYLAHYVIDSDADWISHARNDEAKVIAHCEDVLGRHYDNGNGDCQTCWDEDRVDGCLPIDDCPELRSLADLLGVPS